MRIDENTIEGSNLAEEIISLDLYETPPPIREKSYKPWQKLRKQYVRQFQWEQEIRNLVQQNRPESNTLKYLGLPGNDLLDLRHFHKTICEAENMNLAFLGFNSSLTPQDPMYEDANLSLVDVKELSFISPMSEVINSSFQEIAREESVAYTKACDMGPFDVVNLDLCGGFGTEGKEFDEEIYEASWRLMGLQSRKRGPWLFFLTTRADKQTIATEVINRLCPLFEANLQNEPFRQVAVERLSIETVEELYEKLEDASTLPLVFLTSLFKWFLTNSLDLNPAVHAEVINTMAYRVRKNSDIEDMISIAIKFTPTLRPRRDASLVIPQQNHEQNETQFATQGMEKICSRLNR